MDKQTYHKSIRLVDGALLLLFASVLLPSNIKSIAIGLFAVVSCIHFFKSGNTFNFKFFLVNSAVFTVMVITLLYSENVAYGVQRLTMFLSLAIFPLCFSMYSQEDVSYLHRHREKYLSTYIITVALFNIIPFMWFYITNYSFEEIIEHFPMAMKLDVGKYGMHAIYLSMHCSLAVLFSLYVIPFLSTRWKIIGLIILDLILICFLVIYAKKGSIIALTTVTFLFVVFQRKKVTIRPYLFALIGLLILVVAIPRTRNKFLEFKKIEVIGKGAPTSTNIRYTIYRVAKDVILESPVLGYGVGDYRSVLSDKYRDLGIPVLKDGRLNAHNQFLSFLIIGGVVAFLAFLATLIINFIFAVRFNNELLILVIIFYGILMLTDNILEKEAGVVYFALFFNFLAARSLFALPTQE